MRYVIKSGANDDLVLLTTGKVVDNCVIYLLDPTKEPVESGEVGEIYVAGAHLCSGYVNNREAERFIPNHIENASGITSTKSSMRSFSNYE